MKKLTPACLAGLLAMAAGSACGDTGQVKIQLSPSARGTAQALTGLGAQVQALQELRPIPAELFEMKILSAYVVEDIDSASMDNLGQVERIWVNPDCPSDDGCRDSNVGFFDLSDPVEANRKLNSQAREINAGVYRYVRVEFCIGGAQGNLLRYKTAGMPASIEASYGGCGVTSERMDPPVELKAGETINIALEYDLSKQPLYYAVGSTTCGTVDTSTPCVGGIALTPKIVR
jgi:hypothetical protein